MPIRTHETEDLAVESGLYAFPAEYVRDKALLVGRLYYRIKFGPRPPSSSFGKAFQTPTPNLIMRSNGHLRFVPRQARIDQVALKDCEVHLARIKLIPQADLSVVLVFCAMFFVYCCAVSEGCLR